MAEISDSHIIQKYIAFRDLLDERSKQRATEDAPISEAMQLLEGFMSIRLRERGDESVRTEHGTAYTSRTMSVRTADKEALFNFIRESDQFQLLAGNLSKDAVREHMDEHQGAAPPGVDVTTITKTLFRRA